MNEKLHELELLLQSRDHKIQFLEEEHKKEVLRAAKAEDVTKTYRYEKIDGKICNTIRAMKFTMCYIFLNIEIVFLISETR